jgi:hypothetical protein
MLDPKMTIALVFAIIFLAWRKRERLCLRVIRWGLILILPRLGGWEYLWLRHYLIGKGGRRSVPAETRGDILLVALRNALDHDLEEGIDRGTQILVGSSTFFHMDYEAKESGASNFMARPVLFRLVGGFSVQAYVNFGVDSGGTDGYVRVYGEDEYDWHPNGPDGQWYGSPVDSAKMTRVLELIAKLARLFGVDTSKWWGRNIPGTFCMGDTMQISNRLWADLEDVGARPFTSIIEEKWGLDHWYAKVEEPLSSREWDEDLDDYVLTWSPDFYYAEVEGKEEDCDGQ